MMILITVTTITTQAPINAPQQGTNNGKPTREGAPPPPTATYWAKAYSVFGDEYAKSVQQTSDGGYIAAGYSGGYLWVLKLNSSGGVTWEKDYLGSGGYLESFQQTTDGGYIVAGWTGQPGQYHAWVLKLDSNGGVIWQETYGNASDSCYAYSVQQTLDGGYIVAGEIFS